MDEFTIGFVCGICAFGLVAVVAMTMWKWFKGNSRDTLPAEDRPSDVDPDLRPAVIDYAMEEAAAQVVSYGLTQAEYRAARTRLGLAVKAKRGEALSDMELGVLVGIIAPPPVSTRKDVLQVTRVPDVT